MKTLLAATLLLAPVLLHAQATTPAQPQVANTQALQSKLVAPAFVAATSNTASAPLRISTGVIAPRLIHTVDVIDNSALRTSDFGGNHHITVALVVDEKGVPSDLKVVASTNPETNQSVLDAVSKFRFTPGTLNSIPTEVPVTLTVTVSRDAN